MNNEITSLIFMKLKEKGIESHFIERLSETEQLVKLLTRLIANLDKIATRKPTIVVPGHMAPEAAIDLSAVVHTKTYLIAFEEEIAKAKDSAGLFLPENSMESAVVCSWLRPRAAEPRRSRWTPVRR